MINNALNLPGADSAGSLGRGGHFKRAWGGSQSPESSSRSPVWLSSGLRSILGFVPPAGSCKGRSHERHGGPELLRAFLQQDGRGAQPMLIRF